MIRRRLPPALAERLAAFRRVVAAIDAGKEALLASVPTTRLEGRPIAETLVVYEAALREAGGGMDAWRAPELEEAWTAAAAGLAEARALAERVRLEAAAPVGFEALVGLIGDLLAPLDAFEAAAERFSALRRRRGAR
ncbi:MAG: hypothetical protein ACKO8G_01760 [Actinomycetota bacterium]